MINKNALLGLHVEEESELIGMILESGGYEVERNATLKGTLEMIGKNKYSLVIADINLGNPGSTDISPGVHICKTLEDDLNKDRTKVVFISGNPENRFNFSSQYGSKKNVYYLQKPYTVDQIIALVA